MPLDEQSALNLAKAEAEKDLIKAWALYLQARQQSPKTLDVPKAMIRRYQSQADHKFYGQALGFLLALDPTDAVALNNAPVSAMVGPAPAEAENSAATRLETLRIAAEANSRG